MKKNKQDRLFLDFVKGFLMFIMLWSHVIMCALPSSMNILQLPFIKFIHTFNMPLFMLISGYLFYGTFQKKDLKDLIVHRSKPLLLAIVFYGIFHCIVTDGVFALKNLEFNFFYNGRIFNNVFSGTFWFLVAVLASSLIVSIVCKTIKKIYLQIPILALCIFVTFLFPSGDWISWIYPLYLVGFYFAKYKERLKKVNFLKYLCFLLFPIIFYFNKTEYSAYSFGYLTKNNLLKWVLVSGYRFILCVVASVALLTLLEMLYKYVIKKIIEKDKKPIIALSLAEMGKNSLKYYVVSITLISYWFAILYKKLISIVPSISNFFENHFLFYNYVITPLLTIVFCIALYFIIKLFDITKLSCLFFGENVKGCKINEDNTKDEKIKKCDENVNEQTLLEETEITN